VAAGDRAELGSVGRGLHSSNFQLNVSRFGLTSPCPCIIDWGKSCAQRIPLNVLMLSKIVDECTPLAVGRARPLQQLGRVLPVHRNADEAPGRAVQVDPIKPTLKAPGTERLKLKHEELLSHFGYKFKMRRYSLDIGEGNYMMELEEDYNILDAVSTIQQAGVLHSYTILLNLSRF